MVVIGETKTIAIIAATLVRLAGAVELEHLLQRIAVHAQLVRDVVVLYLVHSNASSTP